MSRIGIVKLCHLLSDKLQLKKVGEDEFFDVLKASCFKTFLL